MCYGDLVQEFGDELLPHVDGKAVPPKPSESALAQLLLKSVSKDKKFVLEASQKVLDSCAQTLEPVEMSHKLIGYLKHKYALSTSRLPRMRLPLHSYNAPLTFLVAREF